MRNIQKSHKYERLEKVKLLIINTIETLKGNLKKLKNILKCKKQEKFELEFL